jgi:hypothetical protein
MQLQTFAWYWTGEGIQREFTITTTSFSSSFLPFFLLIISTMSNNIAQKVKLIHRINDLQTELYDKPVNETMFDFLIEQSEGGLSGIVLALLMIRAIRREENP